MSCIRLQRWYMTMSTTKNNVFRLLLVEDDESHAHLIRMTLENISTDHDGPELSITHVDDGEKAINYVNPESTDPDANRPDMIMLDLNIPKISGHEVLEYIKSHDELRAIPTVIFSSSRDERDLKLAYMHNANSYLTKPTEFSSFQDLLSIIKTYWTQWNVCSE